MTGMTGRVYLERGHPVTVITPYNARRTPEVDAAWLHSDRRHRRSERVSTTRQDTCAPS